MKVKTNKLFLALFLTALFCLSSLVMAEEQKLKNEVVANPQQEEKIVEIKQVEGIISGISPSFIAVLFGRSEQGIAQEMAFNLNEDVRAVHKNSLKEMSIGDTVRVVYEETTVTRPDNSKSYSKVVKQVIFLKPAPKQLDSQGLLRSQVEESSVSEETQRQIPLKGLKGE